MITSEQKMALEMLPQLMDLRGDLLISGLLLKEKPFVINTYESLGWTAKKSLSKKGWALLHFTKN
jgi:ribosomal protein L11 methylase PrmA